MAGNSVLPAVVLFSQVACARQTRSTLPVSVTKKKRVSLVRSEKIHAGLMHLATRTMIINLQKRCELPSMNLVI